MAILSEVISVHTAAPVNNPAVTKSQHYHTQSTTNYCSKCQSPQSITRLTIYINKTLIITAAPVNPTVI